MDLQTILTNIEARLKQRKWTADRVSALSGHKDAIRNLKRAIQTGKGGWSVRTLIDIAKQLDCHPADLLHPPAPVATLPVGDPDTMRDFLAAQRDLLDRQIKALDDASAAKNMLKNPPKRKKR